MRIGMQTWGSDGDILPFLALAGGLQTAGHEVTVAYTSVDGKDYGSHGEQGGFCTIKAYDGFRPGTNLYALTTSTDPFSELTALLNEYYEPAVEAMFAASEQLCLENDLIICHTLCHTMLTSCEKHHRPRVSLCLAPMVIRTGSVAPVGPYLGQLVSNMLWSIGDLVMTRTLFPKAAALRRRQGLPPIRSLQDELFTSRLMTIVATSPVLCPRPDDWGDHIHVTGFLAPQKDQTWQIPVALRQFLDVGPPPVYMTFGTCMPFDREANTRLLVDAALQSGQRAIIQSDWALLHDLPDHRDIFRTGDLPYHMIFPHCSLVVHHGGAGTTQLALLAGCPSVVVGHAYDQEDWAKRLQRCGAAGNPLSRRTVTVEILADAIRSVAASSTMRQKAAELGQKMPEENGIKRAIDLMEARFSYLHKA